MKIALTICLLNYTQLCWASKQIVNIDFTKSSATSFLKPKPRNKRSNDRFNEEKRAASFERECIEETCEYLEIYEVLKHDAESVYERLYKPKNLKTNIVTINYQDFSIQEHATNFIKLRVLNWKNLSQCGTKVCCEVQVRCSKLNILAPSSINIR